MPVHNIEMLAYVSKVQGIKTKSVNKDVLPIVDVDANIVRCPDTASKEKMLVRIEVVAKSENSFGGVTTCAAWRCLCSAWLLRGSRWGTGSKGRC